jgi:hypothetical protein
MTNLCSACFPVTVVSQRNHEDEKGNHVHGGNQRFHRAEKLR